MPYQEYEIAAPLKPFIKVIWSMETDGQEFSAFPMRILPDSCVELVIHFCNPLSTTFGNRVTRVQPKSFIVAQMKEYIELTSTGPVGFVSIRFTAHGAYHFFGLPMKEIANGVTELRFVWKDLAKEVEDKIAEGKTTKHKVDIIQLYLINQLSRNGKTDLSVNYCLDQIYLTNGQILIEDLSFKTGLSNRQLVRRFDQCVGMAPKEFARIVKFIGTTNYLKQNRNHSFADTAFNCGYYDQSHFIRDFKEFSGLTPGQFLLSENVFL